VAEETGTPTLTAPTPVPTAEDPSLSVGGLLTDPEFPNLPLDEKIDVLRKRIKMDPDYRRLPEKMKTRMFAALLPQEGPEGVALPAAPGVTMESAPRQPTQAGPPPSPPSPPAEPAQPTQTPEQLTAHNPYDDALTVNPQAGGGSATAIPQVVGESIARGVDMLPGMVARPVGVALETYGNIPEYVGMQKPGGTNIFQQVGRSLQTPEATRPFETTIAGREGFKPPPGYEIIEHVVSSAVGAGVTGTVLTSLIPALRASEALPLVENVWAGMKLAARGAGAAEVAKAVGLPGWEQVVIEMAAGGVSLKEATAMIKGLKTVPYVRKMFVTSLAEQEQQILRKGTEVFGGPDLKEQYTGGDTTKTANASKLEAFIEEQKRPVRDAQGRLVAAERQVELTQADKRALDAQSVQETRIAKDLAAARAHQAELDLQGIEDQLTQVRSQEGAQARAEEAQLVQRKLDVQDQYRQDVRNSQYVERVEVGGARARELARDRQVLAAQEEADRVSVANQRDMDAHLKKAQGTVEDLSPGMTEAAKTGEEGAVGRGIVQEGGRAAQTEYDAMVKRNDDNFAAWYEDIDTRHTKANGTPLNLDTTPGELYNLTQKYKPAFEGEESVPTAEMRGSAAPRNAVQDFEQRMVQKGHEPDHRIDEHTPRTADEVPVSASDAFTLRSRIMNAVRRTDPYSERGIVLRQFLGEVNAYIDKGGINMVGKEAVEDWRRLNSLYRTEVVLRERAGPGGEILAKNPFTGERLKSPDEVAHTVFGPGPGVAKSSAAQAQNEQNFIRYMQDLDDSMQATHLKSYRPEYGLETDSNAMLADYAAARNAKDRLFDMVKAEFYDAAMIDGKYSQEAASKWLNAHDALIKGNAELTAVFADSAAQARAIRSFEAAAQGDALAAQAQVKAARAAQARTAVMGEETRHSAGLAQSRAQEGARDAQAMANRDIATEQSALTERTAVEGEQTKAQMVQARRLRAEELRQTGIAKETEQRRIADARKSAADRLVAARETAAQEKEALDAANKDYNTMFGGVNAAKHALTQQAAADRLGATPDSIVRQMETLNVEDRNFAYGEWFKKPGMTDEVKQALLQSRWQAQFKTETGGMRVPSVEEAQAFLSNTENQAFFRTYYPDYYKDITMITSALEKAQEVAKLRPHTDVNVGNILHTGMAGAAYYAAGQLGMGWQGAIASGASVGGAILAARTAGYRRQLAALNQMYMNPADAHLVAQAIRSNSPNGVNRAIYLVLTRAGLWGRETETVPTSATPYP
jgi:hypothetical protein